MESVTEEMLSIHEVSYAILFIDIMIAALPAILFLYIERKAMHIEDLAVAAGMIIAVVAFLSASGLNLSLSVMIVHL
jgi:hypothetical protein